MKPNNREAQRALRTHKMKALGYYPAQEVAERVGVHVNSVYRWIANGEVDAQKVAGVNYISRVSLIEKLGMAAAAALGFAQPQPQPTKTGGE